MFTKKVSAVKRISIFLLIFFKIRPVRGLDIVFQLSSSSWDMSKEISKRENIEKEANQGSSFSQKRVEKSLKEHERIVSKSLKQKVL